MMLSEHLAAMESVLAERAPSPKPCAMTRCSKRRASYRCRGCDRDFCGHCARSPIRPDDRVDRELWMTCLCRRCG